MLGTVRTESQVRPHEGFATGEVHLHDPVARDYTREGGRTQVLAKPPAWTERGDLPCVVPNDYWTTELRETHWDVRSDQQAREMCSGCPVGPLWEGDHMVEQGECLAAALREERGLSHASRYLVRGGLTPKGRWSLDVAQSD